VEPTSVTPYAPPARKRTIHSAIIAMIRHATPHRANDQAGSVRFTDPEIDGLLNTFLQRIRLADPTEAVDVEREVQAFIDVWDEQSQAGTQVYYANPGRQFAGRAVALVRDFGDPPVEGLYEAMRSVRNVDPDVHLKPVARG
jgi:hypothetical protein